MSVSHAATASQAGNGTRSVKVKVDAGKTYRFRYLGEDGHWFDDPHHDQRHGPDGIVHA